MIRLLPYDEFPGAVDLTVSGRKIDGKTRALSVVEKADRVVELRSEEDGSSLPWTTLDIDLRVDLDQITLSAFAEDDTSLTVVGQLRCPTAELRQGIRFQPTDDTRTTWTASVHLDRQWVSGTASLRAVLCASTPGRRSRPLGHSRGWRVAFDPAQTTPTSGAIEMKWQDFSAPDAGLDFLAPYDDERFFIDVDDTNPILYLNSAHQELLDILDDRIIGGPKKAMQDLLVSEIATKTRIGLLGAAIASVDPADPDWPVEQWKRNLLEEFIEALPLDIIPEDGPRWIAEARSDLAMFQEMQEQVIATVEKQMKSGKYTTQAIKKLLRDDL